MDREELFTKLGVRTAAYIGVVLLLYFYVVQDEYILLVFGIVYVLFTAIDVFSYYNEGNLF